MASAIAGSIWREHISSAEDCESSELHCIAPAKRWQLRNIACHRGWGLGGNEHEPGNGAAFEGKNRLPRADMRRLALKVPPGIGWFVGRSRDPSQVA